MPTNVLRDKRNQAIVRALKPLMKASAGMRPARLMVPIFANNSPKELEFSEKALQAGVEGLMLQDMAWLDVHPETPDLYQSGVIYKPELHREINGRTTEYGEDWQTIPYVLYYGYGDCEDLGAWRAAELNQKYHIRALPDVKVRQLDNGRWRAHVRVRWPDGTIEDPSAKLGMYQYDGRFPPNPDAR